MAKGYIINKVLVAMTLLMLCVHTAKAQDDVEYRYDIGAGIGATTYYGDFNSALFANMQPAGAVMFRMILNPRSAIRIAGMYTKLKGSNKDVETYYPDMAQDGYEFSSSLGDLSATYEYNFWPYGTGRDYRGAKRIVPFISLGIGLTYASCGTGVSDYSATQPHSTSTSVFSANVPLGFGVKYKIKDRLNLTLDWQMHFSMTDQLDGVKDPYRTASAGVFKNTDCYSTLTLALTYCLSAKCSTCMKD